MTSFEEIEPLAERLRRGFLVTRRSDGDPTVHPLTPIYAEGALYINTYRKSAKVQNLLRDPRSAYVVTTKEEDGGPFRAFEARGQVRLLDIAEVPDSFLAVGTAGEVISQENLDRVRARLASGKRVYLRVEAEEWTECEPLAPAEVAEDGEEAAPPGAGDGAGPQSWGERAAPGRIAMSGLEIEAFLGATGTAVLGTIDPEGRPRGRPVRYLNRAGRLALFLSASSPSLGDLGASPRACATVEQFPTYDQIRGVMAHGAARATGGPAPSGWVRYLLEPERVLSFDFSKIPSAH